MTPKPIAPPPTNDVGDAFAIAYGIALHQSAALACALAEQGLVDIFKVAAWAEFFAGIQGNGEGLSPSHHEAVAAGLKGFADALRSMATKPAGSGAMRQ
jgi:hypothetical protein